MIEVPFLLVIVLVALLIGLLLVAGYFWSQLAKLKEHLEAQLNVQQNLVLGLQKEIEQFQLTSIQLNNQQQQIEQAVVSLKCYLDEQLSEVAEKFTGFSTEEPADKLYSRALKLAAKGADVEELMSECDLPRVEAEMLLAIHRQNRL